MMSNGGIHKGPPQTRALFYLEWNGVKIPTLYCVSIVPPKAPPGMQPSWTLKGNAKLGNPDGRPCSGQERSRSRRGKVKSMAVLE